MKALIKGKILFLLIAFISLSFYISPTFADLTTEETIRIGNLILEGNLEQLLYELGNPEATTQDKLYAFRRIILYYVNL